MSQQAFNMNDVGCCDEQSEVADRCQASPDLAVSFSFPARDISSLKKQQIFEFAVQKRRKKLEASVALMKR